MDAADQEVARICSMKEADPADQEVARIYSMKEESSPSTAFFTKNQLHNDNK